MEVFQLFQKKGLVKLSKTLIVPKLKLKLSKIKIKSIFYVPKLACNLLSVSKLYKDSNCRVTFFDSYCEFQDQRLGRMIDSVKLINGLYFFL